MLSVYCIVLVDSLHLPWVCLSLYLSLSPSWFLCVYNLYWILFLNFLWPTQQLFCFVLLHSIFFKKTHKDRDREFQSKQITSTMHIPSLIHFVQCGRAYRGFNVVQAIKTMHTQTHTYTILIGAVNQSK